MKTARRIATTALAGLSLALILAAPAAAQVTLKNPVTFGTIPEFIAGALKVMVMVALPIITLFTVYSGFLFIIAQGKPEELAKAKSNFVYVIIGSVLILGAWVFASLIGSTISQLTA